MATKRHRLAPQSGAQEDAPAASTFTERCANDSVTLSVVLSCLDVYSIVRARRVCKTWQAATRAPLAWSHCILAVNAEHAARIPVSSVALLRNLTLVRQGTSSCLSTWPLFLHPLTLFAWVGQLRGLRSLRIEGIIIDAQLCTMLSTYAPSVRELDLRLCSEDESKQTSKYRSVSQVEASYELKERFMATAQLMGPLESSSFNNGEHDAQDGLLSAVATSAAQDVKDALAYMRLPQAADERRLPTLRLPHLTSLKLPKSSSYRDTLALMAPLGSLRSLQLHRPCFDAYSVDTAVSERHYLALMNRLFAHTYADTLKHLVLSNMHAHGFESYRFELLHRLTHLSLTHNNKDGGITCAALHAVAALPRLERCEIHVEDAAAEVCANPAWWQALAGVRSLASLAVWTTDVALSEQDSAVMCDGLQLIAHDGNIRLERLRLNLEQPASTRNAVAMFARHPHLHTLVINNDACLASAPSLVRMPHLTSLEIVPCSRKSGADTALLALLVMLPRLCVLKCNPTVGMAYGITPYIWTALAAMPALTSLELSGNGALECKMISDWCRMADEAASRRPASNAMCTFVGNSPLPAWVETGNSHVPFVTHVALQHLRFDSDIITPDQCRQLLRSMPQLQLVSTHTTLLRPHAAGAFHGKLLASIKRHERTNIVDYTRHAAELD